MPAIIIGLSGKMRAGKNTTYMLSKLLLDENEEGVVQRVGFADALKEMARRDYNWNGLKDERGRKLLQDLGLSMRKVTPTYWVDRAVDRIHDIDNTGKAKIIFVTDVRFTNEAEAIMAMGGVLWRIVRPSVTISDQHISETALDDYMFDVTITADTLDELFAGIKNGLASSGIYEDSP
jgi:hypothetical protein